MREHIEDLLSLLWRGGGLRGDIADDAFWVRCDRENNNTESIDSGELVAEVNMVTVDGQELSLRVVFFLG